MPVRQAGKPGVAPFGTEISLRLPNEALIRGGGGFKENAGDRGADVPLGFDFEDGADGASALLPPNPSNFRALV